MSRPPPRRAVIARALPAMPADLSDVEVAARAMCLLRVCDGRSCSFERDDVACMSDEFFGQEALAAVAALRAAGRLAQPAASQPCRDRDPAGACRSCGAAAGAACQHPSLQI